MTNDDKSYKSLEAKFYQSDLDVMLHGELTSNGWEFSMFNIPLKEHILHNINLRDFVELILLGKLMKAKMLNGRVTIEETKARELMVLIQEAEVAQVEQEEQIEIRKAQDDSMAQEIAKEQAVLEENELRAYAAGYDPHEH